MALTMTRQQIAQDVYFSEIKDDRFKTNRISVNLITQLDKKTATVNAIVPFLLTQSSVTYPNFTLLSKRLNELYGASLIGDVRKLGDSQAMSLAAGGIDNAFALEGEDVTEELCKVLVDCLFAPVLEGDAFAAKTFGLERQNLIDTIESEINEKRTYALNRTESILCEGEPAGVGKYGDVETAAAMTAEDAYKAYQQLISSAKVEILFVGCGCADKAKAILTNAFAAAPRGTVVKAASALSAPKAQPKEELERLVVNQSKMALGFKSAYTDKNAIRLMVALYGGTPTAKLFLNVRERLSLCYYCVARFDRFKGTMIVDCGVENDNIEKAKAEILNQLEAVKRGDFTDEEISDSALSLMNSFKTVGDSTGGLEGWYLGQAYVGTAFSPEQEGEALLSVTREDIIKAANSLQLDTVYVLTSEETASVQEQE